MREALNWFASRMEGKLQENDHKSAWEQKPQTVLYSRLLDEVIELHEALVEYMDHGGDGENIVREASDVANFAMMIASSVYPETKTLFRGRMPLIGIETGDQCAIAHRSTG